MTNDLCVSPLRMAGYLTTLRMTRRHSKPPIPADTSERPAYTGVLAKPMPIHIGHLLDRGKPYWYPGSHASWAAHVELIKRREDQAWQDRIGALGSWYDICICFDPKTGDPWHRLAFELLRAHVPGFSFGHELGAKLPGKGAPPVLKIEQTILLASCVHEALAAGERRSAVIANLALAKFDFKVPSRGCGPRKGGQSGSKALTRQTATHLVNQMRSAWRDVIKGKASAFQFQLITLALVSKKGRDMVSDWGMVFGLNLPNIGDV